MQTILLQCTLQISYHNFPILSMWLIVKSHLMEIHYGKSLMLGWILWNMGFKKVNMGQTILNFDQQNSGISIQRHLLFDCDRSHPLLIDKFLDEKHWSTWVLWWYWGCWVHTVTFTPGELPAITNKALTKRARTHKCLLHNSIYSVAQGILTQGLLSWKNCLLGLMDKYMLQPWEHASLEGQVSKRC